MKSLTLLATLLAIAFAAPAIDTSATVQGAKHRSLNKGSLRIGKRVLERAFAEKLKKAERAHRGRTGAQSVSFSTTDLRFPGLSEAASDERFQTVSRLGLTGSKCISNANCRDQRLCIDLNTETLCTGQGACFCIQNLPCATDLDCPEGEECFDGESSDFCFLIPTADGLNGDSCDSSADCLGDRVCSEGSSVTEDVTNPQPCISNCICWEYIPCDSDAACPTDDEICIGTGFCTDKEHVIATPSEGTTSPPATTTVATTTSETPTSTDEPPTTAPPTETEPTQTTAAPPTSETTTAAPPPSTDAPPTTTQQTTTAATQQNPVQPIEQEDPVCVDARALSHLSSDELVFKEHKMANVLCDDNESCATPGHIVVHKGTAMRMSSYCNIVGCSKQRMLVNSPSYRRGMRVRSSTEELHFTAFAARYDTRIEEVFLTAFVHSGL